MTTVVEQKMYTAEVVADSISPEGHRITSVAVVYPHAVHKDMLRHRCMNRNVASFRAMPPEKLIEMLRSGHAFMPEVFGYRTTGMGQRNEAIEGEDAIDQERMKHLWLVHVEETCDLAEEFLRSKVAKQQVNFLLQDFCPLAEIITATDWSNFYALRTELKEDGSPMARPEVYLTAVAIQKALDDSKPQPLDYDQIHLPAVTDDELAFLCADRYDPTMGDTQKVENYWIGVSAGRCARWSYGNYAWWEEGSTKSWDRSRQLLSAGHMSPFEQQARCFSSERWDFVRYLQNRIAHTGMVSDTEAGDMSRQLEYSGNLHGWIPARKSFPYEYDYGKLRESLA